MVVVLVRAEAPPQCTQTGSCNLGCCDNEKGCEIIRSRFQTFQSFKRFAPFENVKKRGLTHFVNLPI